jgi:predicted TPR repeat methyltransferase
LIRAALLDHPAIASGETLGPVLDLGCGTGLLAVALSDLRLGPLVGVDISPAMLEQARDKQLYAELHEADVVDFLRDDDRVWPLILAADVLCYFGALDELFACARPRIAPGGRFVFSCELLQADRQGIVPGRGGWSLGRQGSFAHSEAYVTGTAVAAGFTAHATSPATLRREADAPVNGFVVVLERCRDDN